VVPLEAVPSTAYSRYRNQYDWKRGTRDGEGRRAWILGSTLLEFGVENMQLFDGRNPVSGRRHCRLSSGAELRQSVVRPDTSIYEVAKVLFMHITFSNSATDVPPSYQNTRRHPFDKRTTLYLSVVWAELRQQRRTPAATNILFPPRLLNDSPSCGSGGERSVP